MLLWEVRSHPLQFVLKIEIYKSLYEGIDLSYVGSYN